MNLQGLSEYGAVDFCVPFSRPDRRGHAISSERRFPGKLGGNGLTGRSLLITGIFYTEILAILQIHRPASYPQILSMPFPCAQRYAQTRHHPSRCQARQLSVGLRERGRRPRRFRSGRGRCQVSRSKPGRSRLTYPLQRYESPSKIQCQHSPATLERPHGDRIKTTMTGRVEQAVYDVRKREASGRVGIPQIDNRQV